jgi:uncharacterized membrane protein
MNNKERSVSLGTVVALGFIVLGILNFFAARYYRRTSISTTSLIPGILFISIGVIILIIRAIRKTRE